MSKHSPDDPALLDRLIAFADGESSAEEAEGFAAELSGDPAKRAAFIRFYQQEQVLRNAIRLHACEQQITGLVDAPESSVIASRRFTGTSAVLAAAAVILLAGVAWFLLTGALPDTGGSPGESAGRLPGSATGEPASQPDESHPQPVEPAPAVPLGPPRLVFNQHAKWQAEPPARLGETVSNGPWELLSGMVRLSYSDGTSATLKGPAMFNAQEDKVIELIRGELAANNGEGQRLTVIADGRRIIDQGNSFGVLAWEDQPARVCVFRGEVMVERDRLSPVLLVITAACLLDGTGEGILMNASQRLPFQDSLVVTCGIKDLQGSVLLFPSDIEHGLMEKESDGKTFLLPERIVRFEGEVPVSFTGTGSLSGRKLHQIQSWHPTGPVRSYLLHASPSTRDNKQQSHPFNGSITFEAPIQAVALSSALLDASEQLCADSPGEYAGPARGLESRHGRERDAEGKLASDRIEISEDRRTLHYTLRVGSSLDQVRVFVAAD